MSGPSNKKGHAFAGCPSGVAFTEPIAETPNERVSGLP